ncbi:MAG: lipoyl(octanoyl) transferase LipB [Proteobacteria bacterium]|nr:lipoyl(octanoyl) transferase LipB [Pseudomonadota bacterium]MBU1058102.1 lipoyl(octanoyl) transferase LipB [Pseudomonadota bacterium]
MSILFDQTVNTLASGCCQFRRLGTVEYMSARALQQNLAGARSSSQAPDTLLLLEHPPTYTLGYNSNSDNVLASKQWIKENNIAVYKVDRGGDVTFHGPGQLIGYPVIQLAKGPREAVLYIRRLEKVLISVLQCWGLRGTRLKKPSGHGFYTGVWVGGEKVAAIGIKVDANQVTQHGFALNVHTDLSYFNKIIACGIKDRNVTSLSRILEREIVMEEVMDRVEWAFQRVFAVEPT